MSQLVTCNDSVSTLAVLERLKRGSVQLELAAFKASDGLGARHVMTAMVILGLVLSGLIESSATVALMALSEPLTSAEFAEYVANTSYVTRYCEPINETGPDVHPVLPTIHDDDDYYNVTYGRGHGRIVKNFPILKVPLSEEDNIDSLLREAFLWGAIPAPLIASRVAARYGPKPVIGIGVLSAGLLTMIVPFTWFSPYHMIIRLLQGGLLGSAWPALHMLAVQWFPTLKRTTFVSCYSSLSMGFASAGLLGTPLVQTLGRDALCYVLSVLAVLWFCAWWRLVYDTPASHPRLTTLQRIRLKASVDLHGQLPRDTPPPWRRLLVSAPVWACAIATLGSEWGQATLHLAATKYLKLVYGYALKYDRILSVLPFFGHFLAALLFGQVVDHVRSVQLVSTTTARKVLVYVAHFLPAALLFVLGYTACDPSAPAAMFAGAVVVSGATAAGAYSSAIDIAPNFAGTVFGLSQTIGGAGSLVAAYVVREGLHGSLPMSWRLVFGLAATVLALTATLFMALGSGSVQPWNNIGEKEVPEDVELKPTEEANIMIVVEDTSEPTTTAAEKQVSSSAADQSPRESRIELQLGREELLPIAEESMIVNGK